MCFETRGHCFGHAALFTLPDFQNTRSHYRGPIRRVAEFQVHASTDKTYFQHRSAPGRTFNSHQHRLRTKRRMAPNPGLAPATMHDCVPAVLGLNLEHGPGRQVVEKGSAFDFRFDDVVVDGIVEIGMAAKELGTGIQRVPFRSSMSINLLSNMETM